MGFEPMNNSFADCDIKPLCYLSLVELLGIEPSPHALQAYVQTTYTRVPSNLVLDTRIELVSLGYQPNALNH